MIYYETKLSYTKEEGDGKMKKATEYYVVRALSYADAEVRITEQQAGYTFNGEMEVDIKKVKYAEIFPDNNPNSDKWYKGKVMITSIVGEGDQAKEKKVPFVYLVQSYDIEGALKRLQKEMSHNADDSEVVAMQETKILDYYDFSTADVKAAPLD